MKRCKNEFECPTLSHTEKDNYLCCISCDHKVTCDDECTECKPSQAEVDKSHELALQLLKMANCPNCDGSGAIGHQRPIYTYDEFGEPDGETFEVDWEQCQWCYERNMLVGEDK